MGQTLSCCYSAEIENKHESTSKEPAQPENTPSKEEKYDCKTKGRQQIKELEPTLQGDAQAKKTTKSEVLTGDDSDGYDYDSESELLPPKAQIKELEATSQELAQLENTPIKEEKSDRKTKGLQQIKELEPRLQRDAKAKPTHGKKGTSACDRALEKLRRKQAKDLEAPPQIKTPRPIGPDLCELNLTKYMISRLFDFIM